MSWPVEESVNPQRMIETDQRPFMQIIQVASGPPMPELRGLSAYGDSRKGSSVVALGRGLLFDGGHVPELDPVQVRAEVRGKETPTRREGPRRDLDLGD